MAEQTAQVLTPFTTDPDDGAFTPSIARDYGPMKAQWVQTNPENPVYDPNQSVWQITADETVMDAIELDENYNILEGTREFV